MTSKSNQKAIPIKNNEGYDLKSYRVELPSGTELAFSLPVRPSELAEKKDVDGTREYMKVLKPVIFEMEKGNTECLYLYHRDGKWWQLGGNSTVVFKNIIAPKIKRQTKLACDKDFYCQWKNGVINIKDPQSLLEKLAKIDIEIIFQADELIILKLAQTISQEEIDTLAKAREIKDEKAKNSLGVGEVMPKLRAESDTLCQKVVKLTVNQRPVDREFLYDDIARAAIDLSEGFVKLGLGEVARQEFLASAKVDLETIKKRVLLLERWKMLDIETFSDLATRISDVSKKIEAELGKEGSTQKRGHISEQEARAAVTGSKKKL